MLYMFRCEKCKAEQEVVINIKDYDVEKNRQFCSVCGEQMKRVIEWSGIAEGSGEGWHGKAGSNTI